MTGRPEGLVLMLHGGRVDGLTEVDDGWALDQVRRELGDVPRGAPRPRHGRSYGGRGRRDKITSFRQTRVFCRAAEGVASSVELEVVAVH